MRQIRQIKKRTMRNIITYQEYLDMGFEELEDCKLFPRFLQRATYILDAHTSNFYQLNELELDHPQRRNAFKQAIAAQIEYMDEVGAFHTEGMNAEPQSQQIGRVKITKTNRNGGDGTLNNRRLLSPDVYVFLQGTGLLNRGVSS